MFIRVWHCRKNSQALLIAIQHEMESEISCLFREGKTASQFFAMYGNQWKTKNFFLFWFSIWEIHNAILWFNRRAVNRIPNGQQWAFFRFRDSPCEHLSIVSCDWKTIKSPGSITLKDKDILMKSYRHVLRFVELLCRSFQIIRELDNFCIKQFETVYKIAGIIVIDNLSTTLWTMSYLNIK